MRFDKAVYLQTISEGTYDASTGNYVDGTVTEAEKWANVNDTSTQDLMLVYGGIKQGSVTVRFQDLVPVFDYIRIGTRRYRADAARVLRTKTTFIMSEVVGYEHDDQGAGQAAESAAGQTTA